MATDRQGGELKIDSALMNIGSSFLFFFSSGFASVEDQSDLYFFFPSLLYP